MRLRVWASVVVLLSALGAGCAPVRPVTLESAAFEPACRSAIDGAGASIDAPIDWRAPADDRAALAAWCAAVGPAVIAPAVISESRSALAPRSLTIVSWNAHVGGGDLAGLVAALRAGRFTQGRPVGEFVVLLQEAYRAGPAVPVTLMTDAAAASRIDERPAAEDRNIVAMARALGLWLYYVPSMRNGADPIDGLAEDRGNAILSTLPLSEFAAVELPFERQRRVAIAAVVRGRYEDGTPWRVRVGSAHLDATASLRRLRLFASGVRARQARHLAVALDDEVPTVLGADLNTWAGGTAEAAYRHLRSAFPQTLSPAWRATSETGFLLDFILLRVPHHWRLESRRVESRFGSDHHPLLAELRRTEIPPSRALDNSVARRRPRTFFVGPTFPAVP